MPIAVKHTIKLTENQKIPRDSSIYRNPIADPPAFHVGCTCQWEGWAHSRAQADYFVASHRHAQLMRGNIVEVLLPPDPVPVVALSTPEAEPLAEQPTTADVPIVDLEAECEFAGNLNASAPMGLPAEVVSEPKAGE